jgi:hypothetical protein
MEETVTIPVKLLNEAINALHEVRTGEDFECECWTIADKLECARDGRTYDPDND